MRWLLGMGLFVAVGCAAPTTPIAGSAKAAGEAREGAVSEAPSCPVGTTVVYRRPLDRDAELEVVFTCEGDRVAASSVALPYPKPQSQEGEGAEESDEGYDASLGELDVARFNALRRAITSRIRDGACRPTDRRTPSSIGVGTAKWRIQCAYRPDWQKVAQGLEAALRASFEVVDPRVQREREGELPWPFEGDYWRDELGYYRREGGERHR